VFELVNDRNRVIGRQTIKYTPNISLTIMYGGQFSYFQQIDVDYKVNDYQTVSFNAVNANDISDNMVIRIASVNGAGPQNARFQITALSGSKWQEYNCFTIENGIVKGYDNKLFTVSDLVLSES
jgi:hypothetical protein